jgi:hypothetical protein
LRELGQGLHALRHRRADIVGQHRLCGRRDRGEIPQRVVAQRAETVRVDLVGLLLRSKVERSSMIF